MPTGYTAPVEDGTVVTLEDFTLLCARSFGFAVSQREDGLGPVKRPEFDAENSYHATALRRAKNEKARFERLKGQGGLEFTYQEYVAETNLSNEESVKNFNLEKFRYDAMQRKVETWDAPELLESLKAFMLDQIKISRPYKDEPYTTEIKSFVDWQQNKLDRFDWDIEYHQEQLDKDIERHNERMRYFDALQESLGVVL